METFACLLLEEDKIHFDGVATYCAVTTVEGSIGFEAGHEDCICILAPHSSIEYHLRNGSKRSIAVVSGVLMFRNNRCTMTFQAEDKKD